MNVLEILQPRLGPLQLKGYRKGFFDDSGEKLFAYTILSVRDKDFELLNNIFLANKGYSYTTGDQEKYNNYNSDGSYSSKGVDQLVEEEILKFVFLRFYGIRFQDEWFILDEISFSEKSSEEELEKEIDRMFVSNAFKSSVFKPVAEYESRPDLDKITEILSEKLGRKISWAKDSSLIGKNIDLIPINERPTRLEKQAANFREFIGQPWLVAYLNQERKSKVNRPFENYFNESVLLPCLRKLRIERFDDFVSLETLYSPDYFPLLYPHSKEYVMAIAKAKNKEKKSRLYYFVYITRQMFEWIKPPVHEVPGHYAEWILEDIKDLSSWGEEFDFHEPSITMEDVSFWSEHVFKKENGNYLYLKELSVQFSPL